MRSRSFVTGLAVAAASAAGAVVLGRRAARRREHAELYLGDGSLVMLSAGSPAAERVLAHARELLAAARS
jgi:hypothetical protein